jgi:subtilisin-like proprotein convertase family protein
MKINFYLKIKAAMLLLTVISIMANAQNLCRVEVEPNNYFAQAEPIAALKTRIKGFIYPNADVDIFSFNAQAGDKVWVSVMTSFSANASTDSYIEILASDTTTVLESDNDDGTFGGTSSIIAGLTIPANGIYYIRVRHNSATSQLRPYYLYFSLSNSSIPETEPNDAVVSAQSIPPQAVVSGTISSAGDVDLYKISLNAGETVCLNLSLDPERDAVTWNGAIGLGPFGNPGVFLTANDASVTSPNAEAFFLTVKDSGSYYIYVYHPSTLGDPTYTYLMAVTSFPEQPGYQTYTSTNVPQMISELNTNALAVSTLTITDSIRIRDMRVCLDLNHLNMPDIDALLMAPNGTIVHLLSDIGSSAQQHMDLKLNDWAGIPITSYSVDSGMVYQPEIQGWLEYFKGMNAQGVWTLYLYDDAVNNTGALNGWGLEILPDSVPDLSTYHLLYSEDFEAGSGEASHSGTLDEWEWGAPSVAPINAAFSGVNCWKTDLDGSYENSADMIWYSDTIDLGCIPPSSIWISYAMKSHMESASFDKLVVSVEEVGGTGMIQTLYTWYGASQNITVSSPAITINQTSGWAENYGLISAFAGSLIRLKVQLTTDASVTYTGVAIDDIKVYSNFSYVIGASSNSGGSISPPGPVHVYPCEDQSFTFVADSGYCLVDLIVDAASVDSTVTYTFYDVTAPHSIHAVFAPQTSEVQNISICFGDTYEVAGMTYDSTGTYYNVFTNSAGCDSILITNLTEAAPVNTGTSTAGITITADEAVATSYQWVNCNTGYSAISGETNQSFTPVANGQYAVIVTLGSCADTSACVNINTVGIAENQNAYPFMVNPNPATNQIIVSTAMAQEITLLDAAGGLVMKIMLREGDNTIDISRLPSGLYLIRNESGGSIHLIKK